MRKSNSKYVIHNIERKHHHLVVSPKTHEVVKYYAGKWRVTITEATQRLLDIAIKGELQK